MGLFKSKEEKRREEKMLLNRAVTSMKKQIERLEASKVKYTDAAVRAKSEGSEKQYELAKYGLRIAVAQKTVVEQMLLNLEMTSQAKDASEVSAEFADGMNLLTGEIIKLSGGMNFEKVNSLLSGAFVSTEINIERMDDTMSNASDGFSSLNTDRADVAEELIRQRMEEELIDEAAAEQLSERIGKLKNNL